MILSQITLALPGVVIAAQVIRDCWRALLLHCLSLHGSGHRWGRSGGLVGWGRVIRVVVRVAVADGGKVHAVTFVIAMGTCARLSRPKWGIDVYIYNVIWPPTIALRTYKREREREREELIYV